jgi:hypothetical protein
MELRSASTNSSNLVTSLFGTGTVDTQYDYQSGQL